MSKVTAVFFSIVVLLIVFVLGVGAGVFYQSQQNAPQNIVNQSSSLLVRQLSSKVIPAITAFGQVTNVNGKNITLSSAGENLVIKISDSAQIFTYIPGATSKVGVTTPGTQKPGTLSDIKAGQNLSINLKVMPDNTLSGSSVIIISSATAPAPATK
jgi:hypothetical protein